MTFGERLRTLRIEAGLSQEELGTAIGVSARVVGYYETDDRFPKNQQILVAIASTFQVSLDYLLDNPVRHESSCPSRFCYMKSMDSAYRNMVNQYILFLRWQMRREKAEADAADSFNDDVSLIGPAEDSLE